MNYENDDGDLDEVKILHLYGVAQNIEVYSEFIITIVEDVMSRRMTNA